MQVDIDVARDEHSDLSSRVVFHGVELRDLRDELGAAALEATNLKFTTRTGDIALEAERGLLNELVAENSHLSDAAKALLNARKLRWVASRC